MNTTELLESGNAHNSPSYAPAPVILERGEGVRVWDTEGREYLDFLAGIAVNSLGYAHPALTKALQRQVGELMHVSNMFFTKPQIELMDLLCERSFGDRVFLCNSGAEANETALKLARRYQKAVKGDEDRVEFITFKQSFHGRTFAAITATGQPKYHKGFEPMLPGFTYATFNDLASVEALISERTAAVMVEPIQGEGGVRPADPKFLKGLREICDRFGALLIFDEVQCGIGRTGTLFAYEGYGVAPDIMTLAKGLGGGVPIGACVATEEAFKGFERGSHATTFGGNPLASTAALCVLETVESENLQENAITRGNQLMDGLRKLANGSSTIVEVRGKGLMVGVECVEGAAGEIVGLCRERGLLVNVAGPSTVRFVPPLVVRAEDVQSALGIFEESLHEWEAKQNPSKQVG
jgi:predicted acetylornithine/succinylornithine family transaminase